MMYPYVKYSDGTEVLFSNIYIDNGKECIDVHFERPTKKGFDSVRIKLPLNMLKKEVLDLPSIFESFRL